MSGTERQATLHRFCSMSCSNCYLERVHGAEPPPPGQMNKYGTMVEWQLAQKSLNTRRTSPRTTLFTTNLTRTVLWSNLHLQRKEPATNHLVHGTPSWSGHVLRSLSCCWGNVSSYFSAVLACEFRVPVVYELTVFFVLLLFQRYLFIHGTLHFTCKYYKRNLYADNIQRLDPLTCTMIRYVYCRRTSTMTVRTVKKAALLSDFT